MNSFDPKVRSILCEALERAGSAERLAYLAVACRGNAVLCERVDVLLAAHDAAGRFLAGGELSNCQAGCAAICTCSLTPERSALKAFGHLRVGDLRDAARRVPMSGGWFSAGSQHMGDNPSGTRSARGNRLEEAESLILGTRSPLETTFFTRLGLPGRH